MVYGSNYIKSGPERSPINGSIDRFGLIFETSENTSSVLYIGRVTESKKSPIHGLWVELD